MIFTQPWFEKHQQKLLSLANTQVGRRLLRIDGKRSSVGENKIIRIDPNAIYWKNDKQIVGEFRTHDKYAKRLYYAFKPVWYAFHLWDYLTKPLPKLNLGFDTLTAYPDANPETTTVDGRTYTADSNVIFSTIRAAAGATAEDSGTDQEFVLLRSTTSSDQYQFLVRSLFLFDTATLTSSATISAAVLSLYGTNKNVANGSNTIDIVSSNPAGNTGLVAADHATLGTTVYADMASAAYSTSAYNDFTLDANGIAQVSKTGVSKFGARLGWDTDNSFGGVWASAADTGFNGYFADQTGTSNDPKLTITFTVPSGGFFHMSV